jgi:excinuclease ABC subunit A
VLGARENNLKGIDVAFPLNVFTVVTGVSGSGKTSLVKRILYPALQKALGNYSGEQTGKFDQLDGDITRIEQVEMVDQNPIGRSSRSNPGLRRGSRSSTGRVEHQYALKSTGKL